MNPSILIISEMPEGLTFDLQSLIKDMAQIFTATTGLEGLIKFQEVSPMLIIVDSDLPDMRGASVSTIIKDTPQGQKAIVYLMNVTASSLIPNLKTDRLISAPVDYNVFFEQVHQDLEKKIFFHTRSEEVEQAVINQQCMLPTKIKQDKFEVDFLYSPYNILSGDGMFYSYPKPTKTKDILYGFIFDCAGHDLAAYGQAGTVWVTLRHQLEFFYKEVYSNLAEMLNSINRDVFVFYRGKIEPQLTSIIAFCVDFKSMELRYASAGAPELILKENNTLRKIKNSSHPIGFEEDTKYEEHSIALEGNTEIIFSTDGLNDLLLCNQDGKFIFSEAKHDDVSAIFVKLKIPSELDGIL